MTTVIEPPNAPTREEALEIVQSFPYWYHRIYLGNGVYTIEQDPVPSEVVWEQLEPVFPADLQAASVLDVGCNTGYYSIQVKLRNAGKVIGVEILSEALEQAELCRKIWDLDIQYLPLDVREVASLGQTFDIVLFNGVLYHLKHPLFILEEISKICNDAIIVETECIAEHPDNKVYARQGTWGNSHLTTCEKGLMKFIETTELEGDSTNWWLPDAECLMGMLRTAGFKYISKPCYINYHRVLIVASKKQDSLLNIDALQEYYKPNWEADDSTNNKHRLKSAIAQGTSTLRCAPQILQKLKFW